MGLMAMSERDLQRIEVLSKVVDGRMTLVTAAHVLGLSTRQVHRLLDRIRTTGAASIRHKAIGRPTNNRISSGVQDASRAKNVLAGCVEKPIFRKRSSANEPVKMPPHLKAVQDMFRERHEALNRLTDERRLLEAEARLRPWKLL